MIRFAEEMDLKEVNKIRRQVNDIHVKGRPDIFRSGFCKELEDYIYDTYEQENKDIIIAVRDDKICGFAIIEYIEKPESAYNLARKYLHVAELGIEKLYRRQGIGRELFEFIKGIADKKGLTKIELDMWEFNKEALKFYEALGFKIFRRFLEYKEKE